MSSSCLTNILMPSGQLPLVDLPLLPSPLIIVFSLLSFSRPLFLDSIFRGQISSSLLCICLLMCNFLHKFSPVGPVMTVTQDDISDEDVPPLIPPPCHTQVQACL